MLTTVNELKRQLLIPEEDASENHQLERIIKSVSDAIETYCRRKFQDDYALPCEEESEDKPRLPYDVEDACILWCTYRFNTGGSMGVSSERIDGLGQKNYARMTSDDGKTYPAPPSVLALIDPYRNMVIG